MRPVGGFAGVECILHVGDRDSNFIGTKACTVGDSLEDCTQVITTSCYSYSYVICIIPELVSVTSKNTAEVIVLCVVKIRL